MITTSQWVNNKLIKKEDGYYLEGEDQCVLFHHEYKGIKKGDRVIFKPDSEYEFEVDGEKLYRMYDHQITLKL